MKDSPAPIAWHFTPQPAELPIEVFRERYDHPDMPEKMEMIRGRLFWSKEQRRHVLGMLIESPGTAAVEKSSRSTGTKSCRKSEVADSVCSFWLDFVKKFSRLSRVDRPSVSAFQFFSFQRFSFFLLRAFNSARGHRAFSKAGGTTGPCG